MSKARLLAEWAPQDAVLLAWPHADTDWADDLEAARATFTAVAEACARHCRKVVVVTSRPDEAASDLRELVDAGKVTVLPIANNDTWARDFGPLTMGDDDGVFVVDFQFNGWGLKFAADKDNMIVRRLAECGAIAAPYVEMLDFVLEGGSIESDGAGTLLTTARCLLEGNRNPSMTEEEITESLRAGFGADKVIMLRHGWLAGDDTDGHIDTLARLCPGNTILYSSCDREDDEHFADLAAMEAELLKATDADERPYRLVALPIPEAICDEDGQRLPATYANFLILNDAVLLPVYGDEHYDVLAVERVQEVFPDKTVETVDCRTLIRQHGSLHCVTMQMPPGVVSL